MSDTVVDSSVVAKWIVPDLQAAVGAPAGLQLAHHFTGAVGATTLAGFTGAISSAICSYGAFTRGIRSTSSRGLSGSFVVAGL
jgi:hypothetical protein